jgi:Class II histone deacetylase complex subunits 2 and 3
MDLSFNPEDDQALRLRQHPVKIDELSPVIRLVTVNSAEHVRLCLPSPYEILSDRIILQGLVAATTILRNFNGMEVPNDDARYAQVAEYIKSNGEKETDVFGIRDIEGYMAGHRGLAGLALKRARSPSDDQGGDTKRLKTVKPTWQVSSLSTWS